MLSLRMYTDQFTYLITRSRIRAYQYSLATSYYHTHAEVHRSLFTQYMQSTVGVHHSFTITHIEVHRITFGTHTHTHTHTYVQDNPGELVPER